MNRYQVQLDMSTDTIVFPDLNKPTPSVIPQLPRTSTGTHEKAAREDYRKMNTVLRSAAKEEPSSAAPKILARHQPTAQDKSFSVSSIGAASYGVLCRDTDVKTFAMSMEDIDRELLFETNCRMEELNLCSTEEGESSREDLKAKLPPEYLEYADVFDRAQANKLPPHRPYDHKIELTSDVVPPKSRAYHMSPYKLQKVKEYLTENLSKGFITPSQAPYSSPVLFALKPNGDLRFCVDYRKLNALTRKNRYPLPLIEEVIGKIKGCKHLTKLDIISAFNKLRMHPESEDLTTFITTLGSYKYKVLPFGLSNGPSSFQQYINDILFEYLNDFCQAYLDDILIYSKTKKEHRTHVTKVLAKLREAGLQVDIKKCEFDVTKTVFLGVIVSGEGLEMDPKKVEAVVNWARPTNLKEVQSFVGFVNFYRRFIKGFSKITKPLAALARKDNPFVWTEDCSKAFESLKAAVTSAPILKHFDPKRQAIMETDSSDYVNGGVLSQYDDDGVLHPVAYYSKSMIPAECNYHIYDKELLAIIRCLEHWRQELEFTELPIQIFTDHQALRTFMDSKELSRRQARYLDILSEFNFQVIFRAGKRNEKADALTRMPGTIPTGEDDDRIKQQRQVILTPDRVDIRCTALEEGTFEKILAANKTDGTCNEYREAIAKDLPRLHKIELDDCRIVDGALYKEGLLWVPEHLQTDLLKEIHDQSSSGHPGKRRTLDLLRRHYYWPGHVGSVIRFIKNCVECHRNKAPRQKKHGLLVPLPIPVQRWQDISVDFITGLPLSEGYNAICTIVDRLSKERHYVPCHSGDGGTSAEETAMILIWNVYRLHGLPSSITSDNGPQFASNVWKSMCKRLGIKSNLSTAYHPQTDGQSERANQEVEKGLRTYCNYAQDDWAKWIPMVEFSDNNNVTTATRMSPFYLNKGFHPRMSFSPDTTDYESTRERLQARTAEEITTRMEELLQFSRATLANTQTDMERQANKHRRESPFKEGDLVMLSTKNIKTTRPCKDLDCKQLGPFKIIGQAGTSYKLELPKSMSRLKSRFHPDLLSLYPNNPLPGQIIPPPEPIVLDDQEYWEVDDILDARRHRGRLQYRVKWTGFGHDNEWYYADADEFEGAQDVVDDFYQKNPTMPGGPSEARRPLKNPAKPVEQTSKPRGRPQKK